MTLEYEEFPEQIINFYMMQVKAEVLLLLTDPMSVSLPTEMANHKITNFVMPCQSQGYGQLDLSCQHLA